MNPNEALLIKLVCRLFWLVTAAPGIARYTSDVRMFVDAEKLVSPPERHADLESIAQGYESYETKQKG